MRALFYPASGAPWSVGEIDEPEAAADEVVVDLAYAGLNPVDLGVWKGAGGLSPAGFPHVPGVEGAGRQDGKPVVVFGSGVGVRRGGTAAGRIAVPRSALTPVPAGLDLRLAAVCAASGATAVRIAELTGAAQGDRVVVLGASGRVGSLVVSLLASRGVTVLAQVRDDDAAALVEERGGRPLPVTAPGDLAAALADTPPVAVVDPLAGEWTAAAAAALPAGGRIVSFGAIAGPASLDMLSFYRKSLTLRGYSGMSEPAEHLRCLALALAAAADGRLQIDLGLRTIALSDAAEAFGALQRSERGRIAIDLAN